MNNSSGAIEDTRSDAVIRTDLPDEPVVAVHPDIRQAVDELVTNAIEHSGGEPVTVRVVNENANGTSVCVTDRGPGLPEMERVVLEDGVIETQTYHSRGLGLWLGRSLVNESNGTVGVDSTNGQGTTVRLTFEPSSEAIIEWFLR